MSRNHQVIQQASNSDVSADNTEIAVEGESFSGVKNKENKEDSVA